MENALTSSAAHLRDRTKELLSSTHDITKTPLHQCTRLKNKTCVKDLDFSINV